ncbi:HNH endonuclease, partial [bacterium]|nr:HNH endonuclease [bacterium]
MLGDKNKNLLGNSSAIEAACNEISQLNLVQARKIISTEYPFVPYSKASRSYSERQKTKIFIRDGFIDRYSGERLVFPGTLRLLSLLMPDEFPYQAHWKTSECHIAFWQLCPTIDHIIPVTRGGNDDESNWVWKKTGSGL